MISELKCPLDKLMRDCETHIQLEISYPLKFSFSCTQAEK